MSIHLTDLRAERLVEPIGLGTATPRLTWRLEADGGETEVVQVAASVEVGRADTDEMLWSGASGDGWRQQVRYDGPALGSSDQMWWRVRASVTVGDDAPIEVVSEPATFELGLLDAAAWQAQMVRPAGDVASAAVRFATSFELPDGEVTAARLHLSAHGVVCAELDGEPVGDEVLAPGWTAYPERLAARTHDVTALLRDATSELALTVAPGWFSGRLGWEGGRDVYGDHLGALAQLDVLVDGTWHTVAATGPDGWTAAATPWVEADLYDGETYDPARDIGDPVPVEVVPLELDTVLFGPAVPPVRRVETIAPVVTRTRIDDDTLAVDLGQNIVGWLRVTLDGAPAGAEVVLRHAEVLDAAGRLSTEPLRSAKATDRYVATGEATEIYEPCFTFHGFRYAEITGIADVHDVTVTGVVVTSDLERTGTFSCSDEMVNRLHANVVWGWLGNSVSVPTDCPQRDERLGWTGDAQVFAATAAGLFDVETFFESWLADLRVEQTDEGAVPSVVPAVDPVREVCAAGWGDVAVMLPWDLYDAYGDVTVLDDSFDSMAAWVDWVWSRLDDGVWARDFQYGDWLDPDAPIELPFKAKARYDLVATAYAARSTALVARAATVLGRDADAERYGQRADELRQGWWERFGEETTVSQTGCTLALRFDLAPGDDDRRRLGDRLAELVHDNGDRLGTGFLGTPLLLGALTEAGHTDVAYALLHQEAPPSWLYQVLAGATTIWERWESLGPAGTVPLDGLAGGLLTMVSFNHYAYGVVAEWLHRSVLGIAPDRDDPGYHHVVVAPHPGGTLTAASGSLATRYGPVSVDWHLDGDRLELDVVIPPNTTATIEVPGEPRSDVGSGTWRFGGHLDTDHQ